MGRGGHSQFVLQAEETIDKAAIGKCFNHEFLEVFFFFDRKDSWSVSQQLNMRR